MAITKTTKLIRQCLETVPIGEPFTSANFLAHGLRRVSVDRALSRMAKAGAIDRVVRGIYVRPEVNRYVGKVMPEPIKIAEVIAKTTGAVIQVHGSEAARRLELTTQVSTQPVFCTSGPSRRIRFGHMTIQLRHVSQRKLLLAGSQAGLALAALWYLGKYEVTSSVIKKIECKLPVIEFEALKAVSDAMPVWMSNALFRYAQTSGVAVHHA